MSPYLTTDRATLWHARAEEVYPLIAPGSVSMVWSDGRYGHGMTNRDGWDGGGVESLPDWYAPHIEAWGRLCAPSATVYLWGTADGLKRLDPVMRAAGWTWRVDVIWLKTNPPSQKGQEALTCWADFTEVCGVYQRTANAPAAIRAARLKRGMLSPTHLDILLGFTRTADPTRGTEIVRRWEEGGARPTAETWARLVAWAPELEALGSYGEVWPPFEAPRDFGNVWTAPMVAPSRRLRTAEGETHDCEKPLLFADRAIRASTRIGDTVLDPFGGTQRVALACHRLPAEEVRHAHGIEMDTRWLDAIRPSMVADYSAVPRGQGALFGPPR